MIGSRSLTGIVVGIASPGSGVELFSLAIANHLHQTVELGFLERADQSLGLGKRS